MKPFALVFLMLMCLSSALMLSAQDSVVVPDVRGLNAPQAAAALNKAGLRLGAQNSIGWTEASGVPQNMVGDQSVAAGSSVAPGTVVDVTIMRSLNIALVYDDNDLTLINLSSASINTGGLSFVSKEGTPASFAASRWIGAFAPNGCAQVWSITRNGGAKEVPPCEARTTTWISTNKSEAHFWTETNGVASFSIMDNGIERAVCDAAGQGTQDAPQRCEAYVSGSSDGSEITQYIYLVYTTDAFAFVDKSPDKWMPTAQTTILNNNPKISNPGASVPIGDPSLYNNPATAADIRQLAPGQCLFLTSDNANATPPEPCDPIAKLDLGSDVAFWVAAFKVQGADGTQHECPAATAEKTTICVVPR